MSQYANYVLWEHTEEIKKLLPSQVSQVMRPTSGDMWHCTRIYHENELHSKMHRINFLMKILYSFSESSPPDKCHRAMSSPVNQQKAFWTDGIASDAFSEGRPANFSHPPWKGNKIKLAPCHSNMTVLWISPPWCFLALRQIWQAPY